MLITVKCKNIQTLYFSSKLAKYLGQVLIMQKNLCSYAITQITCKV